VGVLALIVRVVVTLYDAREKGGVREKSPIHFVGDLWMVFAAYFGGAPLEDVKKDRLALRIIVVSILFTGNIVFQMYRASITSELATWSIKLPFSDLQGVLENPQIR